MRFGSQRAWGVLMLCGAFVSLSGVARAQEAKENGPIAPVTIEARAVSGLDLPPRDLPAHPGKEFYQKRLYRGEALSVFVLGGETITNAITDFPIDEYVHYLNGQAQIEVQDDSLTFVAGDRLVVPRGFSGTWTNHGGPRHHLELSVISTRRSKAASGRTAPFPIPRETLAGLTLPDATKGRAREVVYEGPELTVSVVSEAPGSRAIAAADPESFFHILNGSVTLTPEGGTPVQYFLGDNFILPGGFAGEWRVEGRNGSRVIEVVAQDL